MKVSFEKNPRPIDAINPYVTLEEWRQMSRGNFTITPNTLFSHFFTTVVGGVIGYKFTSGLISRGVPIGPMESFKVLKSAQVYRTISSPVRYLGYLARVPTPITAAVGLGALVLYTGMNVPTQTDESLNIPYNPIGSRHRGN